MPRRRSFRLADRSFEVPKSRSFAELRGALRRFAASSGPRPPATRHGSVLGNCDGFWTLPSDTGMRWLDLAKPCRGSAAQELLDSRGAQRSLSPLRSFSQARGSKERGAQLLGSFYVSKQGRLPRGLTSAPGSLATPQEKTKEEDKSGSGPRPRSGPRAGPDREAMRGEAKRRRRTVAQDFGVYPSLGLHAVHSPLLAGGGT